MELLELPFEPASASVARRHVVHVLRSRGVESAACEDAALVVSELVGNALRHGQPTRGGRVLVGWQFDDEGLRLEVTDGGGGRPEMQDRRNPWSQSGRGLAIVAALAERWGYALDGCGTTVWAAVSSPVTGAQALDLTEYGETG
jgi:two-component sensor histidine kinase